MTAPQGFLSRLTGACRATSSRSACLLYAVAAVFIAIVAVLGLIATQQSRALSQVRAYTNGEGLYSKAQKSAVISLLRYARTGAAADYGEFLREIEVPLGDRDARLALQKRPIDRAAAQDGFLRGRNHPDDIEGLIEFFGRFDRVSYVAAAIAIWEQGDAEVARLHALGAALHDAMIARVGRDRIDPILADIMAVDERLTRLEDRFSATLGDGARFLVTLSNALFAAVALGLVALGLVFSTRMAANQQRAENALRLSEARYRSLTERMLDGVLILQDGRFVHANPAALRVVGYTLDELRGNAFAPLIHEPFRALVAERHRRRLNGETLDERYDIQVVARDGAVKWVSLSNVLIEDWGGAPAVLTIMSDITEVRAARDALDSHRAQLESLVQKRTVELIAARERAEAASKAKSDFLANVSHEMRTPLNAVLGLGRIGQREFDGHAAVEKFAGIVDAGEHLLGVIDDLLDVARIEAGKLSVRTAPFRLASTIDDARRLVAMAASDKGLALAVDLAEGLPEWIEGDARRLRQILVSLLSNAIKFTDRGSVTLFVDAAVDTLRIDVRDTGIGLTEAQRQRLFTPFEQGDSSLTRRHGGNGLGLALSRGLARLMGGDIDVASTYGEGSCFTLRLPLRVARPEQVPSPMAPAGTQRLAGLHVLAAEDVAVNRLILGELLKVQGATVVFAENGEEAVRQVADAGEHAFDIVLMDIQMPAMDGYEATRHIRAIAPGLPIVAQTAHARAEDHARCLGAGMVAVVVKPIDVEMLVRAMLAAVGRPGVAACEPPPQRGPTAPRHERGGGVASPRAPARDAGAELIDWATLEARYPQPGFMHKVAHTTLATHGATPGRLRDKAQARDLSALRFLTHTVKGLGGNLEARRVQEMARRAEAAARSEHDEVFDLVERLAREMEALLAEIARRYPGAPDALDAEATVL